MPTLIIKTNADLSDVNQGRLLEMLSSAVAGMLAKPERYVMVILEPNPHMCFGGDGSPLAYVELKSLGLPEGRTREFSATLCGLMQQHLGVPQDRIYIEFASPDRHLFGFNAGTFG